LDPVYPFLHNSDLLCLFLQIGRVQDGLEGISHMMIHLSNDPHLAQHGIVTMQLIDEHQDTGRNPDQQIVQQGASALYGEPVQHVLQEHSQEKYAESQQETCCRAS
jgi:hypothetical protein